MADMVNHPPHYNSHPSGIQCVEIAEHLGFLLGNAFKYIWRAGLKGKPEQRLEDLKKAQWYLDRDRAGRNLDRPDAGFTGHPTAIRLAMMVAGHEVPGSLVWLICDYIVTGQQYGSRLDGALRAEIARLDGR